MSYVSVNNPNWTPAQNKLSTYALNGLAMGYGNFKKLKKVFRKKKGRKRLRGHNLLEEFNLEAPDMQRLATCSSNVAHRPNKRPVNIYNVKPLDPKAGVKKTLKYHHASVDDIGTRRIYDLMYPPITAVSAQGGVKINAYRDKITANKAADGVRQFGGRDQDVMQLCFLDCAEFMNLSTANLDSGVSPDSLDVADMTYYQPSANSNWRNLTMANGEVAPVLESLITPNRELLLEQYKIHLTITNMTELDLCFEIAEVVPKKEVFDTILYGKFSDANPPTYPSNSGVPTMSYQNDPLTCIIRDLHQENKEADQTLRNITQAGSIKDETGHAINSHGQRLYMKKHDNFNHWYSVASKSYFRIAGGNSIDYQTEIAGFLRSSDFNHIQTLFQTPIPLSSGTTNAYNQTFQYALAPTYANFTKFIIIKAWSPNVVTSDANDTSLGWAGGKYSVVLNTKKKFRGMTKVPTPAIVETITNNGGANETVGLDTITLANTEFINEETMQVDTDPGAQL